MFNPVQERDADNFFRIEKKIKKLLNLNIAD